jgi:hypothetical protein
MMFNKSIITVFVLSVLVAIPVHAATIVWVSEWLTNPQGLSYDHGWIELLEADGHTVIADMTNNYMTLDAAKLATLENADLIIFSRTSNSGNYVDDDEETQWNSIETPLILMSAYLTRSSRWQWINSTAITEFQAEAMMRVVDSGHQIFTGVAPVNGQIDMIDGSVDSGQNTFLNASDVGNGTLIAQRADDNSVWIAEWQAGIPFYSGDTQIPAEKRMLFTAGGGGSQTAGSLNLTENGQRIFINAVRYMLGLNLELGYATNPKPYEGEVDVLRDTILSWTPGEYADKHNVYFGMNFDDVNAADTSSPLLVGPAQDANSLNIGRLEFEKTYYWRIDEINAPPDTTVFKGPVWNFTTEYLAYPIPGEKITATATSYLVGQEPEETINGSGLDPNSLHSKDTSMMWLTPTGQTTPVWIKYEFDKPHKLHEMLVWNYNGNSILTFFGLKDVVIEYSVDGTNWTQIEDVTILNVAPGAIDYAANTIVAFGDVVAKYVRITAASNWSNGVFSQFGLSEVRFMYIPVSARQPNPDDTATDIPIDTNLGWKPGREAAEHNLYLSTNRQEVAKGTIPLATVNQTSYSPPTLDIGKTYYWRVDEINNIRTPATWQGDIWSFTTSEYIVVDDFESYNDTATGTPGSNLVYATWTDGYDDHSINGSTMGYPSGNSLENSTVHGGRNSVPLLYDNGTATLSEVTVNTSMLDIGRNWTIGSARALSLWFYGDPNNATTEQMYVKLNSVKIIYNGDPSDIANPQWTQWDIDLASFGIDLNNVMELIIGFERTTGAGGSGTVLIDDIRLYGARCLPSVQKPAGDLNDDCVVDYFDLVLMADNWLTTAVPEDAWNGAFTGVDIGTPTTAGSFSLNGGTYTIQGSGADIWSTTDAFHYAYRQTSGDFQMTVRAVDITAFPGNDGWTKAGIMVRKSLNADSANVFMAVTDTAAGGSTFQWRSATNGDSTSQRLLENSYTITKPVCIRLVRQGNLFTGYVFLEGMWQQQGQTTVTMTDPVYIGLAVTSHSDDDLSTVTFDRACAYSAGELQRDDVIDFKDFAILADTWLGELLWPNW